MKKKFLKINIAKLINIIEFLLKPIKFLFVAFYLIRRKPFSIGYEYYKWIRIKSALNKSKKNLNILNANGLDERIIEYQWIISELKHLKGNLLDAGSTLNFPIILNKIKNNFSITIQTMYPENYSNFDEGVSYIYSDLVNQSFKENYFDVVTCVSTIEHVGCDIKMYNTTSTKKKINANRNSYIQVIKNFKKILKNNGILLITIPYGKYERFNELQQFDKRMVNKIIKIFNPKKISKKFAIYKNDKWQASGEKDCENINFRHISEINPSDNAASARSIIMLKLQK